MSPINPFTQQIPVMPSSQPVASTQSAKVEPKVLKDEASSIGKGARKVVEVVKNFININTASVAGYLVAGAYLLSGNQWKALQVGLGTAAVAVAGNAVAKNSDSAGKHATAGFFIAIVAQVIATVRLVRSVQGLGFLGGHREHREKNKRISENIFFESEQNLPFSHIFSVFSVRSVVITS